MRKLVSTFAAVLAALMLSAPAAPAAQSAGWNCVANDVETDWTLLVSGGSFFPIPPIVPPEGPKVITRWNVTVGPGLAPIRQRLEAFQIQNEEYEFKKLGESALETLVEGFNSFPTRIPVSEGSNFGLYGPEGTLFCGTEEGAVSWLYEGRAATGEIKPFKTANMVGTPVVVTIEDDRDNDGYGDETQDGCPKSGAYQTACPPLDLATSRAVKRRAILVRVTSSNTSWVQAFGQVGFWARQPDGSKRRRVIALRGGPSRPILAGETTTFRLPLTKPLLSQLERRTPRQTMRANLTVGATDVFGSALGKRFVVRLRGRG